MNARVSVLMPTYNHAAFVRRALTSLLAQTLTDWELAIVDDGSKDDTAAAVSGFLADPRISYHRLEENRGLGAALNVALERTTAPLVAYLPSDDVMYSGHLESLAGVLEDEAVALAYSGVRHHYNRYAAGRIEGEPLQLVQVMHRRAPDRWPEREELVTDDLGRLMWDRLGARGELRGTGAVSCEWVDHPGQLHKAIREPLGGVNPFRARFQPPHPLRFRSTVGNAIDEVEHFRPFRERPPTPPAPEGLRILLVGELAYNPERVLALEERGHTLFGLWTPEPHGFNYVGPMPFGHVRDLPRVGWEGAAKDLGIDLIYGLLNWQAVEFVHEVMKGNPGLPLVWHFKEGPFICLEKGSWPKLVDLYEGADGQVYSSAETRDWFDLAVPGLSSRAPSLVLDGDLPKRDWFAGRERSPRLSETDGEPHTVVPGRPIGLHVHMVGELAAAGVHLHFYGDFTQHLWQEWVDRARLLAPRHLHLHPQVDQERWVEEFSRYDAGWLHFFESRNGGDLRRADWDDLNLPARIGALAAAGLPLIQRDNTRAVVSSQRLARELDVGLFAPDMAGVGEALADAVLMARLRENAWARRHEFTFDHHADRLVAFFREVLAQRR